MTARRLFTVAAKWCGNPEHWVKWGDDRGKRPLQWQFHQAQMSLTQSVVPDARAVSPSGGRNFENLEHLFGLAHASVFCG